MTDAWLVVLGGVISLATSSTVQFLQGRQGIARQRSEWDHQRDEAVRQLQRDTLIALQDRVTTLLDLSSTIYARRLGDPGADGDIALLNQQMSARFGVVVVGVRVRDQTVRDDLDLLLRLCHEMAFGALDAGEARDDQGHRTMRLLGEATEVHLRLNRRVGELLRGDAQEAPPEPAA